MKLKLVVVVAVVAAGLLAARHIRAGNVEQQTSGAGPALTIYNQNFAVVRQNVPLELRAGVNALTFNDITAHLEPDSVILRDAQGSRRLQVLEQNYRSDAVSQELLLSLYEGRTLSFRTNRNGKEEIVQARIIRSGYVPHYSAMGRYGQQYQYQQYAAAQSSQPLVEINGELQFGLPGQPIFPALGDDSILKPTLSWQLATDKPGAVNAELSYITGGMRWDADYNVVAPENGEVLELVGWVTIDNQSGKRFDNARIRLMAGDVNKIQRADVYDAFQFKAMNAAAAEAIAPAVTERNFDEYHLYTLQRPVTLRDHETKQVEFVSAGGVRSHKLYVYDGAQIDFNRYRGWSLENIRTDPNYGTQSNPKVWVMQELKNSAENHLGMALPRGSVRFYRRDEDGRLQFTGENFIDHTPKDETVRLYTGNAFDLTGERRRTDFHVDSAKQWADEGFEIKVRNHKKEAVTINVVEHLYRWSNWDVTSSTHKYAKKDAQTIEFAVPVAADGEQTIRYSVHYHW